MIALGYLHSHICCVESSRSVAILVDAVEDDCDAGDGSDGCAGDGTGFMMGG
jgi:hypothetical protein